MPGHAGYRLRGRRSVYVIGSPIAEAKPWRAQSQRQLWFLYAGDSPIRFATRSSKLPNVGSTIRVGPQDYRVLSVEPGSRLGFRSAVVRVEEVEARG